MGRRRTMYAAGLSVPQHEWMAGECTALLAQVEALRVVVRDGLSSASEVYGQCNHVLSALRRLQSTLLADLALTHGGETLSMAQVRAIYGEPNGEG